MHDPAATQARLGAVHSKRLAGDHLDFCRFARGIGFRWVELKYETRLEGRAELSRNAPAVARFASEHGLRLSVHAPYDDPVNIAARDEATRRTTMDLYRVALTYAARIGARYMTLHGGHIGRSEYSRPRYREVAARTVDALRELREEARGHGISLCLENRHRFDRVKLRYPMYPAELRACRDAVGNDLLFTIDTGHANSLRRHGCDDVVRCVGPDAVGIAHLHDNDGTADQHLEPGAGTVGIVDLLRSWLQEEWRFPLLLELNAHEQFVRGRDRLVSWADEIRSGSRDAAC